MAVLNRAIEWRGVSLENPNVPLGDTTLIDVLAGGESSQSGIRINDNVALTLSAVWKAINTTSGSIAAMPLKVFPRSPDGGKREAPEHPVWQLLHETGTGPNPEMCVGVWLEFVLLSLLLRGNSINEVIYVKNTRVPAQIWPISTDIVTREFDNGRTFYLVRGPGEPRRVEQDRILHVLGPGDGYWGKSPVHLARESLGLSVATERYGSAFFGNSATPSGFLVHPAGLKFEHRQNILKEFEGRHGGTRGAHRVGVMGDGIKWQQVGLSAEDSQFLESRKFQIEEIARWFNIQPHKIGALEHATFTNIEQQNIEFVQDTLSPWLTRNQQAMNKMLLTVKDRADGFFIEFIPEQRLRGDTEVRSGFYSTQFQTGALTPNEIRKRENNNPIEGGDQAFVQLNLIPLAQAGSMTVDERARLLEAGSGAEHRTAPSNRGMIGRRRLTTTFQEPVRDAFVRMIRGEIRNIRTKLKAADDVGEFLRFIERYYMEENPPFVRKTIDPVLAPFGRAIAGEAVDEVNTDVQPPDMIPAVDAYLESLSNRASVQSRIEIEELVQGTDDADIPDALEERFVAWDEGTPNGRSRAERMADNETNKMANFVARGVFAGMGVVFLKWRTVGKNCPYCNAMNGRTVGIQQPFLAAGTEFQPEGADTPLKLRGQTKHPPLHRGCDCMVVPD